MRLVISSRTLVVRTGSNVMAVVTEAGAGALAVTSVTVSALE
jgi:hypothetical protein